MVARMMLRGLVAAWVGFAIVSLQSAEVRAADAAEVEALIAKGNELRRAGTPGPALPYFQKAYELARTPRTTGQLGLAELAAGYPVEAAEHLTVALQSPHDPSIVKYRQMLDDALKMARAQIGELTVKGGPAGAEIVVDGRTAGVLPLASPIKLAARNTEIVVRAPGYAPRREQIPIVGGQHHELAVNLEKTEKPAEATPAVTAPAAASPPAPAVTPVAPAPVVVDQHPASGGDSGSALRTAAWITGGAAIAAAGTGLVLNLSANSKSDDFNQHCVDLRSMGMGIVPRKGETDCQARLDSRDAYRLWSIVGYVGGAALAVTSGILFWTSRPASAAGEAHARLTCAPTLNGLACQGLF